MPVTTITCPHCHQEIELSAALAHQLSNRLLARERESFKAELAKAKLESGQKAVKKLQADTKLRIKSLQEAAEEERQRSRKLTEQLTSLMKELRQARRDKEDVKLQMEKRLNQEENKIRQEIQAKADEAHFLKSKEKDKVIADLKKALAAATRRAEQGSQQTQGEVLELEIETKLRREFPDDKIEEIKKGVRGADVIQTVIDKRGRACGKILWESKNARWSQTWLAKLKSDSRAAKAHLAVLVAAQPPEGLISFSYFNGVWVVIPALLAALASTLRYNLISLHAERLHNVGKREKSEILYQYVTSHEFRARIEAIAEAFTGMQAEIEREKRWFQVKWNRQEKQLRAVIDHTHGIYGDVQGVVGRSLPQINTLKISDSP